MVGGVTRIPIPGERKQPPAAARADNGLSHFICGPENRLARVILERVLACVAGDSTTDLESPSQKSDDHHLRSSVPNPIVFTGPIGCGKTHIIEGLVTQWQSRFGRNEALCTTTVDFARQLTQAGDASTRTEIRKAFRSRSLLAIDNLERLPRRAAIAEELINLIDAICRRGGLILIASTEPPGRLPDLLPALRSRLCQGLVVSLAMPDRLARRALTQSLSKHRGMTLSEQQIDTIAGSVELSPREIARQLTQWSLVGGNSADVRATDRSEPIGDPAGLIGGPSAPSLRMITTIVARNFSLRQTDLRGKSRQQSFVYARGIAMYLARDLTDHSLAKIGNEFGGRDHTTVLHACRKTATLVSSDAETQSIISKLRRILIGR